MFQSKEKTEVQAVPVQKQAEKTSPNTTMAIPQATKSLFEVSSGFSLDEVRVHRQSDYPAQFKARACTVGPDIYLAPGQEASLPHELGHVLQNALHPVKPTGYVGSQPVNTSPVLEREADILAARIQTVFPTVSAKRLTRPKFGTAVQGDDFTASVSLVPMETAEQSYPADALLVDTIKLSGRTRTAMPDNKQGNHTIADAFIKKFQKIMVREKPIDVFLGFYYDQLQIIKRDDAYQFTPDQNSLFAKQEELEKKNIEIKNQFDNLTCALEFEIELACNCSKTTMTVWRRSLTNILYLYNAAYSLSKYATTPGKAVGHDEKTGMEFLRSILKISTLFPNYSELLFCTNTDGEIVINQQLLKLLDMESANKTDNKEYIFKKFCDMLIVISQSNQRREKSIQDKPANLDLEKYLDSRKRTDFNSPTNPVTILERDNSYVSRLSFSSERVKFLSPIFDEIITDFPNPFVQSIKSPEEIQENNLIHIQTIESYLENSPVEKGLFAVFVDIYLTKSLHEYKNPNEIIVAFTEYLDNLVDTYYSSENYDELPQLFSFNYISEYAIVNLLKKMVNEQKFILLFKLFDGRINSSKFQQAAIAVCVDMFTTLSHKVNLHQEQTLFETAPMILKPNITSDFREFFMVLLKIYVEHDPQMYVEFQELLNYVKNQMPIEDASILEDDIKLSTT